MPLKSKLFRGDAKLEAAATTASAHIMRGAKGDHVAKIQYAISRISGEPLEFDGQYGPKTAAAVLSFKRKWNIINRSYESQPDDITGVMTMAALDKEMCLLERAAGDVRPIKCGFGRPITS